MTSDHFEPIGSKKFEISAAGGADWYNTSNTYLVVSAFETDSNIINQISTNGAWKKSSNRIYISNSLSVEPRKK